MDDNVIPATSDTAAGPTKSRKRVVIVLVALLCVSPAVLVIASTLAAPIAMEKLLEAQRGAVLVDI